MANIYQLTNTVLKTETFSAQKEQKEQLKKEIQKKLNDFKDDDIKNAVEQARNEGNEIMAALIEDVAQEAISTSFFYKNDKHVRSDLFLVPIITTSSESRVKLPSLSFFEKQIKHHLQDNQLIDNNAHVILAPILLGYKTSLSMNMSKWYELHQQSFKFSHKRNLRPIYPQDFFITTQSFVPTLSFIVGLITQDNTNGQATQPLFLRNGDYQENKINFEIHLKDALQNKMHNENDIEVLEANSVLSGIVDGYITQQEKLLQLFISQYVENSEIEFALLSLDLVDNFVILAWDIEKNQVVNCLLVEPLGSSLQDNIDKTMDLLSPTGKTVYIGNTDVPTKQLEVYSNFDLQAYLNENGASVIRTEENSEFN